MRSFVPLGRFFFSAIFIAAGPAHFMPQSIGYAAHQGIPAAHVLVPLTGIIACVGGLSVLFGYHARIGAGLIALFLVLVTPTMHNFWAVSDPMTAGMQQAMFMKNLAMLGGALLITWFGAGPLSLDVRRESGIGHTAPAQPLAAR